MALTLCTIAGEVTAPDNTRTVRAITFTAQPGAFGVDADRTVMGPCEYAIVDGLFPADARVWAGVKYQARVVYADGGADTLYVAVPEAGEGTTIYWQDLVANQQTPITVGAQPLYRGSALVGNLTASGEPAGRPVLTDGTNGFMLGSIGAGIGDMVMSTYDTDSDGKVNVAETADSVPWAGVTGRPATFPPSEHTHDDRYYTKGQSDTALAGKAPLAHSHDAGDIASGLVDADRLGSGAIGDGTHVLTDAQTFIPMPSSGITPYCVVQHSVPPGTQGGTFLAGADRQRPLNHVVANFTPLSDAELLASNAVKLLEPTSGNRYYFSDNRHTASLVDAVQTYYYVDGTEIGVDQIIPGVNNSYDVNKVLPASAWVHVAAGGGEKSLTIWQRPQSTVNVIGMGNAESANGRPEVYSHVTINYIDLP